METLPPIHQKQQSTTNSQQELITQAKDRGRRETRFLTWHDQQVRKREKVRAQIPFIDKVTARKIRSTYKHNLCVEMLKDGFHKSFSELYTLLGDRRKLKLHAGPDSPLWQEPPLDDQHEKLEELAKFLTKAELMQRNGKWKDVYECRVRLAEYFLTSGDKWLSDHFFNSALETSRNIRLDGRRRESEAHCNRALALERNGDLLEAVFHMQTFQEITTGQPWKNDDEILLTSIACHHLCRIYTTLAHQCADVDGQLRYLRQAYTVASDGNEALAKARCSLSIAKKYEELGESEMAIKCLNESLEIAQDSGDAELLGEACKAMAISLQSLGDIKRSLDFFEMYAESAKEADLLPQIISASCCLGKINITQGEYEKSLGHCEAAFNLTDDPDNPACEESDVLLGLARGFAFSSIYRKVVDNRDRAMVKKLLLWKDERVDEPQPDSSEHSIQKDENRITVTIDPTEPFNESEQKVSSSDVQSASKLNTQVSELVPERVLTRPSSRLSFAASLASFQQSKDALGKPEQNKDEDGTDGGMTTDTSYELPPATSDEVSSEHEQPADPQPDNNED